ncbi:hypothetical protein PVK06_010273 [Gossypium arboreum]|uniref:GOLD domain-containing protein n=1 Tax=Gossypium arboreum TaxID=29729 RepID=A0ABR0QPX0_GOSAR|nr:hypothetical protein PVK06_010273 [Gossypium arboreum]
MASTGGLVPITRAFLASYYEKYPFDPLPDDVSRLSSQIRSFIQDLIQGFPPTQGESLLIQEADTQPPHKMDENMWKNRENIEEILFLLERPHWPSVLQQSSTAEVAEFATTLGQLKDKFQATLTILESFQSRNSERVFNTVMTYMPQDFRGTLIRQQKERSERNKQAEVDALINSGGSIRDRYSLLWKQQMDRPMEEQRQRYGPPLYSLTRMVLFIRLFLSLAWLRFEAFKLNRLQISVLEEAVDVYTTELQRFINFISEVFANSPFFISAEDASMLEMRKNDEYKEITVPAGKSYEVSLTVESINSYIAWDFSLVQGKMSMDIGFSVEYTNNGGEKTLILPYRRYESDQGNFSTCMAGNYKLIWDNSYSAFFKKALRYKVDCIPPVLEESEKGSERNEVEE